MKTAYFDCSSGISGDMCLGALIHAGADINLLQDRLASLPVKDYTITGNTVLKMGIAATKIHVTCDSHQPHRHLKDIVSIINDSSLSMKIKKQAIAIFPNWLKPRLASMDVPPAKFTSTK